MKPIQLYHLIISLAIIPLLIMVSGCSPKTGSGALRFFFDGVPEKKQQDSLVRLTKTNEAIQQTDTMNAMAATGFLHAPYKKRECNKCHTGAAPGKSVYSQDAACYTCHESYTSKYEYVHGPVAAGFCTTCHAPHYSDNKKLLTRQGQALCLGCHDRELVFKNETHTEIGTTSCTECHNPHGGTGRFILN